MMIDEHKYVNIILSIEPKRLVVCILMQADGIEELDTQVLTIDEHKYETTYRTYHLNKTNS